MSQSIKPKFTSPQRSGGGPSLTVYVANMAEDVWQYLDTLPSQAKVDDIRGCDLTSDRELTAFLATPNFVLISPIPIDPDFISYIHNLKPLPRRQAGKTYLEILVPSPKTGQVSLDITKDRLITSKILALSQKYAVRLESYSASQEFIALVDFFRSQNPTITAPLTPSSSSQSVVDFFGSKSGLRHFYESHHSGHQDFIMPKGRVCATKTEAVAYAQTLYRSGLGVVFKTPKGHSGIGVVIVKKTAPSIDFNLLLQEPYWDLFPIIVEEYIPIDRTIGGGTPNAEGFVNENGQVEILYTCGMRLDEHGGFQGMEIGPEVLPTPIVTKLHNLGNYLGGQYARKGYRGYFDLDGMIDQSGNLIISESNVRRTGGTHVFRLAQTLLGNNFADHYYLLSNNYYTLSKGDWSFSHVLTLLKPLLYDPQLKSGLIITGANTLQDNFFSYAILAENKPEALAIEKQMKDLLLSQLGANQQCRPPNHRRHSQQW